MNFIKLLDTFWQNVVGKKKVQPAKIVELPKKQKTATISQENLDTFTDNVIGRLESGNSKLCSMNFVKRENIARLVYMFTRYSESSIKILCNHLGDVFTNELENALEFARLSCQQVFIIAKHKTDKDNFKELEKKLIQDNMLYVFEDGELPKAVNEIPCFGIFDEGSKFYTVDSTKGGFEDSKFVLCFNALNKKADPKAFNLSFAMKKTFEDITKIIEKKQAESAKSCDSGCDCTK